MNNKKTCSWSTATIIIMGIILVASLSLNVYYTYSSKNDNNIKENNQDTQNTQTNADQNIKDAIVMNLKEAVQEEINYFGNKSNFSSDTQFNNYQKYVNKMKNANLSDYTESDDKVNIYIFAGKSCWHCLDAVSYLASTVDEFKQYANVKVYEVWYNKNNSALLKQVGSKLNKTVSGVPFIVVGDKTFSGFGEDTGKEIISEAKKQYESNTKVDIVKDLLK